jgi:hypothetical protein
MMYGKCEICNTEMQSCGVANLNACERFWERLRRSALGFQIQLSVRRDVDLRSYEPEDSTQD